MKFNLPVLCAIFLCGCQTKQIQEMSYTERQELAGQIVQRCLAQGVKPGSPEMSNCTMAEAQRENYIRQRNEIRVQQRISAAANSLNNTSQNYYNAAAATQRRQLNCRSQQFGSQIHTNCY